MRRRRAAAAFLAGLALTAWVVASRPPEVRLPVGLQRPAGPEELVAGEYLFRLAGCEACHTDGDGGGSLAGGRPIATPFGVVYSSNITPDPHTGIGGWSLTDFVRALRHGVGPGGRRYYPAFPYTSYTQMTLEDMRLIYEYLKTREPLRRENAEAELDWFLIRPALAVWQALYLTPGGQPGDAAADSAVMRGRYIAGALTHCTECHTPRNRLGALRRDRRYAGATVGDESAPNITSSRASGIGKWSDSSLLYFLEAGMLPDGDFAGSDMAEVIDNSLVHLTGADRRALRAWLRQVPAID